MRSHLRKLFLPLRLHRRLRVIKIMQTLTLLKLRHSNLMSSPSISKTRAPFRLLMRRPSTFSIIPRSLKPRKGSCPVNQFLKMPSPRKKRLRLCLSSKRNHRRRNRKSAKSNLSPSQPLKRLQRRLSKILLKTRSRSNQLTITLMRRQVLRTLKGVRAADLQRLLSSAETRGETGGDSYPA